MRQLESTQKLEAQNDERDREHLTRGIDRSLIEVCGETGYEARESQVYPWQRKGPNGQPTRK